MGKKIYPMDLCNTNFPFILKKPVDYPFYDPFTIQLPTQSSHISSLISNFKSLNQIFLFIIPN